MKYEEIENPISKKEFWNLTTIRKTEYGVMLNTQTDICEYGQAYKKGVSKEEYKNRYLDFYYRLYIIDFETSKNDLDND